MRIHRLELERYGPFTGQSLAFDPAARLHIVHGPNEAGKSCSLAALTDLLFGIEARTRYDFLHDGRDLRLGATIEARNGVRLDFRRRKGNKNTLLDAKGDALGDDALLPFLGGLSRTMFQHAFGLTMAALREGGAEISRGDGEIGASLFAAATGLRGLTELRQGLEQDAEKLFAPQARKRVLNEALERHEAARRQIRERELRAGDWKARQDRIATLAAGEAAIAQQRRDIAAEQARLSRLQRVAPLLRQIDAQMAALAELGPLPAVAPDFAERLRAGLARCGEAADDQRRQIEAQAAAQGDHDAIAVDDGLLGHAGAIKRLFGEIAVYTNSRRDLPAIRAEADAFEAELERLARRLGSADGGGAIGERQPSDAQLAGIRQVITDGRAADQAAREHRRALAAEAETLAGIERQRDRLGPAIDPRPLHEQLAALSLALPQLDTRREIERRLTAETRNLAEAALRLAPPVGDLGALARLPLPNPETIARFRQQADRLARDRQQAEDRASQIATAIQAVQLRLGARQADRPVPSAEVIAASRQARDQLWQQLRAGLTGSDPSLSPLALPGLIEAFERHGADADRLADLAVGDAERVAAHAADSRLLAEEQRQQELLAGRLAEIAVARDDWTAAWQAVWRDAGLLPLPPAEMAHWLSSVTGLLERRDTCRVLADDRDRIDGNLRAARPAFDALARAAGLPPAVAGSEEGDAMLQQARQIRDRLTALSEGWEQARSLEIGLRDSQARLDRLRQILAEAEGGLARWPAAWQAATAGMGLASDPTLDQADATLQVWQAVPGAIANREDRRRRILAMEQAIAALEGPARTLCAAIAPDLADHPVDLAVRALNERLTAAEAARARREQAGKRLAEVARAGMTAAAAVEAAQAAVALLTADLPGEGDPAELLARLTRQADLDRASAELRQQVMAVGDGIGEAALRADLAGIDIDQVQAALALARDSDTRLEQQARDLFAELSRERHALQALETGGGAELAHQQRRNAEAELAATAHDWAVLKLGSLLLAAAIDRHRAGQQAPLMARAGDLFALVTGAAFAGFDQDYDEDDTPRLVARRASGALVAIDRLSEGTRDQLYLALRLAYLEDYAGSAEPVPFIADDLFASFDEVRTGNGLAALAAIGADIQPILFTHHAHLVDIARDRLGAQVDVVRLAPTS